MAPELDSTATIWFGRKMSRSAGEMPMDSSAEREQPELGEAPSQELGGRGGAKKPQPLRTSWIQEDPTDNAEGWAEHKEHFSQQGEVRPAWADRVMFRRIENVTLADGSKLAQASCAWYQVLYDERTDELSLLAGVPPSQPCPEVYADLGISLEGLEAEEAVTGHSSELLIIMHSDRKSLLAQAAPTAGVVRENELNLPVGIRLGEPGPCFDSPSWLTELDSLAVTGSELTVQGQGVYRVESAVGEAGAPRLCRVDSPTAYLQDLPLGGFAVRATLVESAGERRERKKWLQGEEGFSLSLVSGKSHAVYEVCSLLPGAVRAQALSHNPIDATVSVRLSGAGSCTPTAADILCFFARAVALHSVADDPGD